MGGKNIGKFGLVPKKFVNSDSCQSSPATAPATPPRCHARRILENVGQAVPEGLLALRDQPHLFFSSEFEAAPIFSHGVR